MLETDNRLDLAVEGRTFLNEAGRLLGAWSICWTEPWARDLVCQWCGAEVRPGALATAKSWRQFLLGFSWSLQNEVRHASNGSRAASAIGRFVPLLEQTWAAWRTVIAVAGEENGSVGWAIVAPLGRRFAMQVASPAGGWSVSLRQLVARVVAEGGRNDLFAFQQVDWGVIDFETLALVADAAVARASQEIARRPPTDHMIDGLIAILSAVGVRVTVPLSQAQRVLACLQSLGARAPRANAAAFEVERAVRARTSS